jgi:hypothetical protein
MALGDRVGVCVNNEKHHRRDRVRREEPRRLCGLGVSAVEKCIGLGHRPKPVARGGGRLSGPAPRRAEARSRRDTDVGSGGRRGAAGPGPETGAGKGQAHKPLGPFGPESRRAGKKKREGREAGGKSESRGKRAAWPGGQVGRWADRQEGKGGGGGRAAAPPPIRPGRHGRGGGEPGRCLDSVLALRAT